MASLLYVRLCPTAAAPHRASAGAAGYDIAASHYVEIKAGTRALVPTGLQLAIPEGYYGRLASRSGLAVTSGIHVGAGVIDSDYRGEVFVLLFNFGSRDYLVSPGQRIAQLILEKIAIPQALEVASLNPTDRGHAAFGSTDHMAPPVLSGEIIKIFIPSALLEELQHETLTANLQSLETMAKAFITAQADFFFACPNVCYVASYVYSDVSGSIILIFLGGASVDALLTNNGLDDYYLTSELQEYIQEAAFDYWRLIGENISLEQCKAITVSFV